MAMQVSNKNEYDHQIIVFKQESEVLIYADVFLYDN
jgi:hypothetical protein